MQENKHSWHVSPRHISQKPYMHSWHVLEQTKTQLVRADKLKNMANSKRKPYMEESEVSKDYSEGSKCPGRANSQGLGEVHLLILFLLFFFLTSIRHMIQARETFDWHREAACSYLFDWWEKQQQQLKVGKRQTWLRVWSKPAVKGNQQSLDFNKRQIFMQQS